MRFRKRALQDSQMQAPLENPDQYCFFWKSGSPFSQWHNSRYVLNGIEFSCAEQGMMHGKAVLFGDTEIATAILECTSPRKIKVLGRKIRGFKERIWKQNRERIVLEHNVAKFQQNTEMLQGLLNTQDKIIVEASPSDAIWGIGLNEGKAVLCLAEKWPGLNLLGKVLMRTRNILQREIQEEPSLKTNELVSSVVNRLQLSYGHIKKVLCKGTVSKTLVNSPVLPRASSKWRSRYEFLHAENAAWTEP